MNQSPAINSTSYLMQTMSQIPPQKEKKIMRKQCTISDIKTTYTQKIRFKKTRRLLHYHNMFCVLFSQSVR